VRGPPTEVRRRPDPGPRRRRATRTRSEAIANPGTGPRSARRLGEEPPTDQKPASHDDVVAARLGAAPGTAVGGWPDWVQDPEYPACEACGKTMTYLLTIASEEADGESWRRWVPVEELPLDRRREQQPPQEAFALTRDAGLDAGRRRLDVSVRLRGLPRSSGQRPESVFLISGTSRAVAEPFRATGLSVSDHAPRGGHLRQRVTLRMPPGFRYDRPADESQLINALVVRSLGW